MTGDGMILAMEGHEKHQPPAPETVLVEGARRGDRAAMGRLYELYAPAIHGILLARVARRDVEDLVHDVFITAINRLAQLRDAASFPGWLMQIARNHAMDHHRRTRPVTPEPDGSIAPVQSQRAEAERVLSIIRALPDAYRETLVLRLVEGMTGPEISERTGLTPGSVRVNLHRGMKLLRERLDGGNDA